MTIDADKLRALAAAATPGPWQGYSEPEVGLPYTLFSGVPMQSGFGPLEPLACDDIDLVALLRNAVPTILAQADRIAVLEGALRRCGEIVEQNLYRQHEKVEDVPTIVARALGSDT